MAMKSLRDNKKLSIVSPMDHIEEFSRHTSRLPTFMFGSEDFDMKGKPKSAILKALKKAHNGNTIIMKSKATHFFYS